MNMASATSILITSTRIMTKTTFAMASLPTTTANRREGTSRDSGGQIKMIHGCGACFAMKFYIKVPSELLYGTVCIVTL